LPAQTIHRVLNGGASTAGAILEQPLRAVARVACLQQKLGHRDNSPGCPAGIHRRLTPDAPLITVDSRAVPGPVLRVSARVTAPASRRRRQPPTTRTRSSRGYSTCRRTAPVPPLDDPG